MASKPSAIRGARIVGERYVRSKQQANPEGRMPLMDHLRELRNRVVKAALAIIIGMIIALCFSSPTINWIMRPFCEATVHGLTGCKQPGDQLTTTGIFDPLSLRIKLAFYIALIGTCPIWLYQLWAFIAPGLYGREKKWAYLFTGTAVPLFVGGAVLAYLVMSRGLHYLLGLTPGGVLNLPSFDTYLSYFTGMIVGFGIVFELPLVIVMLNLAGHSHPRAVPQVAPAADLRRLPDLRHREPEPRPDDDAHPRRGRGRAGRDRRDLRVLQRQAPGQAQPATRTSPTTSFRRSTRPSRSTSIVPLTK